MATFKVDKTYVAVLALNLVQAYCYSTEKEITPAVLDPEQDRLTFFGVQQYPQSINLAKLVWAEMININSPFKITHDGYLKLWSFKNPVLLYQMIFLDEAQDTNPITHEIILAQSRSGKSSLIFVGDTHQAIYSWRKAVNAMALVSDTARYRFPLTTSFRFGQTIADNASKLLGYLDDPVRLIGLGPTTNIIPAKAVIGRVNGTLIGYAADAMFRHKQQVHFAGTSHENNWDPYFLYEFQILLDLHYLSTDKIDLVETPQIKAFKAYYEVLKQIEGDGNSLGGDEELYTWVKLLEYLGETALAVGKSLPELVQFLRTNCTSPEEADLSVSTAHRAKGLEWESVEVLGDFDTIPPRYEMNPLTQRRDEHSTASREAINLIYVAATRAAKSVKYYNLLEEWLERRLIGQIFDPVPPPKSTPPPKA